MGEEKASTARLSLELDRLRAQIAPIHEVVKLLGWKVLAVPGVEARVDPEILGGVIARVGGKLLDGSTRSKLAALKRELVGAGRKI